MMARPPAFSTAVAMVSSSQATTTGPSLAASARRSTCAIIGRPAISASGLPGSRVEAIRAGMRMRMSSVMDGGVIRVARDEENRVFVRRRRALRSSRRRPFSKSRSAMDSFELNKVLGAVLGTCLALLSLNIAAGAIFATHNPEKPGFEIAAQEQDNHGKPGEPAAAEEPLPVRFASADVGRGENAAKKCATCHTFGKGEPDRVGPNLYGVVGRPKGSEGSFAYSAAMKGKGGNWTVDDLNAFLTKPSAFVPGTKMSFAGLPRGSERADVIAFLNTKSDNPAPLPKAAEAGAPSKAAETAPAGQKK